MIECSRGESGLVSQKCEKMKDAEPFPDATVGLERITLGPVVFVIGCCGLERGLRSKLRIGEQSG